MCSTLLRERCQGTRARIPDLLPLEISNASHFMHRRWNVARRPQLQASWSWFAVHSSPIQRAQVQICNYGWHSRDHQEKGLLQARRLHQCQPQSLRPLRLAGSTTTSKQHLPTICSPCLVFRFRVSISFIMTCCRCNSLYLICSFVFSLHLCVLALSCCRCLLLSFRPHICSSCSVIFPPASPSLIWLYVLLCFFHSLIISFRPSFHQYVLPVLLLFLYLIHSFL